jgi:hypothetical protein
MSHYEYVSRRKHEHIPQCSSEASAMSQAAKYKFIREIVNTLGAGAKKVAGSLNKGRCGYVGDW